ncbi:hypothetical protein OK015_16105 [Mycobacterium sp. Aquia_216]|nr:hypothetical protein [Mycobacterium sp. Aquia_216]WAJ42789.1 hypothetical protein OK015_16105 [Mycobacterium sp. Aquia_216]
MGKRDVATIVARYEDFHDGIARHISLTLSTALQGLSKVLVVVTL